MEITNCSMADYGQILRDVREFWGNDGMLHAHHSIFVHEFGNSAFVIKEGDLIVTYLFGFLSQTAPIGYVHLSAVRRSHRRQGLGRRLYDHFTQFAARYGCSAIKAMTTPTNRVSIAFHTAIGMEMQGVPNEEGISVVHDYGGPGDHRVVFHKPIGRQACA